MPLTTNYDVIIAGGGLSGLLAAREIASSGFKVKVLEEDAEIGVPEKCAGLVSIRGLKELGVMPSRKAVQNEIRRAVLHSPGGIKLELDASRQGVVVVNRAFFDEDLARQARSRGAEIDVACRVAQVVEGEDFVDVEASGGKTTCQVMVDARGSARLVSARRRGLLQAGKYLVSGRWFNRDTVELYFDQDVSLGYFTWVIPVGDEVAKVGVAGRMLNPFAVLDKFILKKGGSVLTRIAAPIYVGGPLEKFVSGRVLAVGDAAGQTKPSTAGGIYSGGVAGVLAGKAVCSSLIEESIEELHSYEKAWRRIFGREFRVMLQARRVFEKMNNHQLDELFQIMVSSGIPEKLSSGGDFDFHSVSLLKMLGLKLSLQMAKIISENEVKSMLTLMKSAR